jgi:hypothetical protein
MDLVKAEKRMNLLRIIPVSDMPDCWMKKDMFRGIEVLLKWPPIGTDRWIC